MMEEFLKISGICLTAALLSAVLDRRDHAYAMALGALACALALMACVRAVRPAVRFLEELNALSGLEPSFFSVLVKTVGIGIVTQICCAVCADCGQNAMAKASELCGLCACVALSLPLMRAALDVIRQMMGA